jgi:dihydropteroate synthase
MFSFKSLIENQKRPLVMGILNVTPDSFSDGGESFSLSGALERLHCLEKEGADIIDIGACSTAPTNEPASCDEEIKRLSFLPEIVKAAAIPLSIDTFRPKVAEYALSCGVKIVNDESGKFSKEMAEVVKRYNAGWIFMHTGGKSSKDTKEYPDGVINDVLRFFKECETKASDFGIDKDSLFFDFGIGFGKSREDDLTLLSECEKVAAYYPLLIGVSRKRIIGEIINVKAPKNRIAGSVAAATLVAYKGAEILRVHDVKETVDAMNIVKAVTKGYI